MTTPRRAIKSIGSYGSTVNVYEVTLSGTPVTRCEWRELDPASGELRRKTETFRGAKRTREDEALAFARVTAQRLQSPARVTAARPSVGDLWEAFVAAGDWRAATRVGYVNRWQKFMEHVPRTLYADQVQPETLDRFRNALLTTPTKRGEPMARNQVAHHVSLVKSVWRHAKSRRLLLENPLEDYTVRKGSDYQPRVVPEFTGAEFTKLLRQLSPRGMTRWRAWAAIALDGLLAPRSRSLLALTWADVDLRLRQITWPGPSDKRGRTRVQPLPRDAVYILRVCAVWRRREAYTGPYVFFGPQNRTRHKPWSYSALNQALHVACDRAGVPRIPFRALHGLRRFSAGNILALTGDITRVGDWLGDVDVQTLRRSYLRDRPEVMRRIADDISLSGAS